MDRIITETAKRRGVVVAVRGISRDRKPWQACTRTEAVRDNHQYFVRRPGRGRGKTPIPLHALTRVSRIHGRTCDYLRSVADDTPADNLSELPELTWPPAAKKPPSQPAAFWILDEETNYYFATE